MKRLLAISGSFLAGALVAQQVGNPDAPAAKARAYELYEAKRFADAAAQFQSYLQLNADDIKALFDYASLLVQLNRHEDAARQFELLHQKAPQHEAAYFKLGVEYVALKRIADAERVFSELQRSTNQDMAAAGTDALRQLKDEAARQERMKSEMQVYDLARAAKHAEVVAAVTEMEKKGEVSFQMQIQRLHSLSALREYALALDRADTLAQSHPAATDLMLVRADLLAQLDRSPEAEAIWQRLIQENPGTPVALEASRRLEQKPLPAAEDRVFALARAGRHGQAVEAIDDMEKSGALSWPMELQRVYSLQASGQNERARAQAERLAASRPDSTDLALVRADQLIGMHQRLKAAEILKKLQEDHPGTPVAKAAEDRLHALPPIANLDKGYWGEAYASGDYLGRYGTVVGSGFVRHGWFIPEARRLQPYVEHRFGVDTHSDVSGRQSIIADNHVGFYGGLRAQLFESEYLFVYGQGGVDKDLLERREDGDWALDYQAGIYGFKSWGPGTTFRLGEGNRALSGGVTNAAAAKEAGSPCGCDFLWRGDWFVDTGADFSYYHRYSSAIGYGQAHEGFRVFQIGPRLAFDAYIVENITWDVRGNYFDNYVDFGPGARFIWTPGPTWQVVLRADWLKGYYFGRDQRDNRGDASSQYDGVQVGLSVGARW